MGRGEIHQTRWGKKRCKQGSLADGHQSLHISRGKRIESICIGQSNVGGSYTSTEKAPQLKAHPKGMYIKERSVGIIQEEFKSMQSLDDG